MTETFRAVDRLMQKGMSQGVFPGGVILVAVHGKVVFRRAYGSADCFSRRPMACETVFDQALVEPISVDAFKVVTHYRANLYGIVALFERLLVLLSAHPQMSNCPDIGVARKISSSEYQLYACG